MRTGLPDTDIDAAAEAGARISVLKRGRAAAMTLLELMIAMALMTVIVLALYNMFDQTQRVLRGGVAQVDIMEGGRVAMDYLSRELEQMQASRKPDQVNFFLEALPVNTMVLDLPGGVTQTNDLQKFFFLTKQREWNGIGYVVESPSTNLVDLQLFNMNGVGSLYRFEDSTNVLMLETNNLLNLFTNPPSLAYLQQKFHKVIDGVVHLRVLTFGTNGLFTNLPAGNLVYTNQGLPQYLELELGILEPQNLEQVRSIPNPTVASNILANQAGRVHLFRQRIPIRTASP